MIRKLRRRMTAMMLVSLLIVVTLFVASINFAYWRQMERRAENTMDLLEAGGGRWAAPSEEKEEDGEGQSPDAGRPPRMGQRREERELPDLPPDSPEFTAGLSSFYTVRLDENGQILSWDSQRRELYTDSQVEEVVRQVRAGKKERGWIGTQFFRMTGEKDEKLLIVLDERMERLSAGALLRQTVFLGLGVYLVLAAAAFFLTRRMFAPAEEANRKQKQFIWDASHELKTPIAVMSANAEVLEREIGHNEWLGYIRSELDRTTRLVQSLLELARTESGTAKVAFSDFDLSRTVMSVALPFESTVFENGKTLEIDIPDGIHATGNPDMISQLTLILLSNAAKYSGEGGTIRLTVQARGRNRTVRVWNSGSYLSPEEIRHVFDRFYRVDQAHSREIEGHGLGLAIAQNIMTLHRGKIQVESSVDGGTAFEAVW